MVEKLTSLGITSFIDEGVAVVDGATPYHDSIPVTDIVVVIGGDGSVIDAAKLAVEYNIPLLGVNMGRIGYLSEVDPEMLDSLSALVTGEYFIDERMLLTVDGCAFAVNDVVLLVLTVVLVAVVLAGVFPEFTVHPVNVYPVFTVALILAV